MFIKNKKAGFEYELLDKFVAGIQLVGSEIKSIRLGKISINDTFCSFVGNELFLINCHIDEYKFSNQFNHEPKRNRKLLLNKKELKKLQEKTNEKGLTIVPSNIFINDNGLCKVTIHLAKGKKLFDKRKVISDREQKIKIKRDLERL